MASPTERIGVCHCGEIAERNNWMFREQPVDDVGIDAHMEFIESSGKPKQLLALQIKSGASWFKEKKDGYIIFRNINNRHYNFLLSQKKFMQIIHDGGEIKLHSTEWVHKSSGRGNTELIVDDGKSIEKYSYPYWFPSTPYTMVFPRLFPWADFSADEDFFEENDKNLWREYHCYYDKEEAEWLIVGDTFEEFRRKLNPMRSIDHSGEVAEYMMKLSLNELGKSFLNVDKFVSQNQPYTDTRPKGQ